MRDDKKLQKHAAITKSAYSILETKGYAGTSMLSIAKASKTSNETLYRWYGDKHGLFMAMVQDNASEIKTALNQEVDLQSNPSEALARLSPILLGMLLGERAVSLNRAAAADPSGELGAAISLHGRGSIEPLFARLMSGLGPVDGYSPENLTTIYLSLLIGDLQIKRAIGVMPLPSTDQIEARCSQAIQSFECIIHAN